MSADIQYYDTGISNFMYHGASQVFLSLIHSKSHQCLSRNPAGLRGVGVLLNNITGPTVRR